MVSENPPKQTATKTATKKTRGITFCKGRKDRKNPWQLQYFHDGTRKREFFATRAEALNRQAEVKRSMRRHGKESFQYDRKAHVEYTSAKELVGDVSLVEVAEFYLKRIKTTPKAPIPNVSKAIEHFIETKDALGRSSRHVQDLKSRLGIFAREFGNRTLNSLSQNIILDWLLSLNQAPRTIKNLFGAINNFLSYSEKREWIENNPCRKIDTETDLPTIRKAPVGTLSVEQGHTLLHLIEREHSQYLHWFLVQYFAGVRREEATRFHGEWIDMAHRKITLPGWFLEGEELKPGTKTRDDWVIDAIDPHFWEWLEKYPMPKGTIKNPAGRPWNRIKHELRTIAHLNAWPANALRHSFATYDLSAHRDQTRTSLTLRHQSPRKLWSNYLAKLVSEKEGKRYFTIAPK